MSWSKLHYDSMRRVNLDLGQDYRCILSPAMFKCKPLWFFSLLRITNNSFIGSMATNQVPESMLICSSQDIPCSTAAAIGSDTCLSLQYFTVILQDLSVFGSRQTNKVDGDKMGITISTLVSY